MSAWEEGEVFIATCKGYFLGVKRSNYLASPRLSASSRTPVRFRVERAAAGAIALCALSSGMYVSCQGGGGGTITVDRKHVAEWETLTVIPTGTEAQAFLRTHTGHYICSEKGGGGQVNATRTTPDIWETFTVVRAAAEGRPWSPSTLFKFVSLQCVVSGHFVVVEKTNLRATSTFPVSFRMLLMDGETVAFATARNRLLHVNVSSGQLSARAVKDIGPDELFTLVRHDDGKTVHVMASNGMFWCAEKGGGSQVCASRSHAFEWETFVLTTLPGGSITPPGPPSGLAITLGDARASVAFSPPADDGGAAVEQYVVTTSAGHVLQSATSPVVLEALAVGVPLSLSVQAINSAGEGPVCSSAPFIPLALPGPVKDVEAVPGCGEVTISFSPPEEDGGSPITSYKVISSPDGIEVTGSCSPLLVTGLVNGQMYAFLVLASNAVGYTVDHVVSPGVVPYNAEGAPVMTAVELGPSPGEVLVSFSPPSGTPEGVGEFEVTSSRGHSVTTCTSPACVSGLPLGHPLVFHVAMLVSDGVRGPESSASRPIVCVDAPGPPVVTRAVAEDGAAVLHFSPPQSDGGARVHTYHVVASPGGARASGPSSPVRVCGLANRTTYTLCVAAQNEVAEGPMSPPSAPVFTGNTDERYLPGLCLSFAEVKPDPRCVPFVEAVADLLNIFDYLGGGFGILKNDVVGNLANVKREVAAHPEIETITELVLADHGRAAVMWVARSLKLLVVLVRELGQTSNELSECAKVAYSESLAEHHSWTIRAASKTMLLACPTRASLLNRFGDDGETRGRLQELYGYCGPTVSTLVDLYAAQGWSPI